MKGPGVSTGSTGRRASVSARPRAWPRSLAVSRRDLRRDAVTGIPGAVGSVPDGISAAELAGVNLVHRLFASGHGGIQWLSG